MQEAPRQPASGIRPLSPAKDAAVTARSHGMSAVRPVLRGAGRHGGHLADGLPQPSSKDVAFSSKPSGALRASVRRHRSNLGVVIVHDSMVTSIQTRIRPRCYFPNASVDPTEARD